MTRADYFLIATTINGSRPLSIEMKYDIADTFISLLAKSLADKFDRDAAFDRERFLAECGVKF